MSFPIPSTSVDSCSTLFVCSAHRHFFALYLGIPVKCRPLFLARAGILPRSPPPGRRHLLPPPLSVPRPGSNFSITDLEHQRFVTRFPSIKNTPPPSSFFCLPLLASTSFFRGTFFLPIQYCTVHFNPPSSSCTWNQLPHPVLSFKCPSISQRRCRGFSSIKEGCALLGVNYKILPFFRPAKGGVFTTRRRHFTLFCTTITEFPRKRFLFIPFPPLPPFPYPSRVPLFTTGMFPLTKCAAKSFTLPFSVSSPDLTSFLLEHGLPPPIALSFPISLSPLLPNFWFPFLKKKALPHLLFYTFPFSRLKLFPLGIVPSLIPHSSLFLYRTLRTFFFGPFFGLRLL